MEPAPTLPQFSVIIPAYNYGMYLREAIDSALAQRDATFEVIVIDDGSTDATRQIVAEYEPDVRYFYQPNRGPYVACKRGLEQTTAPYVVFLDADDRLCPDALAHAASVLRERPDVRMLFGPWVTLRPDGETRVSDTPCITDDRVDNFRRYIDGRLKMSTGGAVLCREVFDRLWSVPEPFFHGYDRVMVAQGLAWHTVAATDRPLFELRMHEGRLRENAASVLGAGLAAVEALFDPKVTPAWAAPYRATFAAALLLEQARLLYRRQRYGEAARAFATRWATAMRPRNLRRYARCLWGARSEPRVADAEPARDGDGVVDGRV